MSSAIGSVHTASGYAAFATRLQALDPCLASERASSKHSRTCCFAVSWQISCARRCWPPRLPAATRTRFKHLFSNRFGSTQLARILSDLPVDCFWPRLVATSTRLWHPQLQSILSPSFIGWFTGISIVQFHFPGIQQDTSNSVCYLNS